MQYRKLGKWGVRVSEVALGSWLTYGGAVEEDASVKQIRHALDKGINFIDTANVYARGQAEIVVGRALKCIRRDHVFLASKVFFPMGDGPNDRGLSRKHVFEQCHASLKRLDTDYIDLYQCHRYDGDVPMLELVRAMDDLTRQGKILYWGVSEWPAPAIEEAVRVAESINAMPPVSNQPCYNMLVRGIEEEVIPVCAANGLGQVVFSPLAQGVLTGKYKPGQPIPEGTRAADERINMFIMSNNLVSDEILRQVAELVKVADEMGCTMAQLALAWILRLEAVSSVICGATRLEQIDDNIEASGLVLSDEVLRKIESLLKVAVNR
ncbi:MAG: aldo/keto reductase family protein [Candidatus Melainabacteria bacterium]|nr:aldo/keto reductase family protein [Candidatus Melainabacteria bacterium]